MDSSDKGATLGEAEHAVLVGNFAPRFDDTLRGGGVIAQGASLAGREDGVPNASADITIAGIPAGATVQRALLYWSISGGADTTATINGTPAAGVALATAGQTCWGADNATFRADVTSAVTGNGTYTIGDLPSSSGVDTNGAGLVVVYQDPSSPSRRRVMIRDGAITSSETGEVATDTFAGVAAPLAAAGRFHLVVGDGQTFPDGEVTFNGGVIAVDQFPGSDGSLWDVNTYSVAIPSSLTDATWTSQTSGDCLVYVAAVLDFDVATCGDGLVTGGETCDQGGGNVASGDGCSSVCAIENGWTCSGEPSVCAPICGDGVRTGGEACDDGDTMSGDGCSNTCAVEPGWTCIGNTPSVCSTTCGDGIRAGAEACDDGDVMSGDGCSNTCAVEPGWTCIGNTPSVCMTTCGDGIRAGAEACDDGDVMSGDGCSNICAVEPGWTCAGDTPSVCMTTCGDGIRAGAEACDDDDTTSGDGCSATCTVEPGWTCTGQTPDACETTCGDGIRAGAEACDDGDTASGDGCSASCTIEPGWSCTGEPSVCSTSCGDGIVAGAEACDDSNTTADDGCNAACAIEPGWTCSGQPSACDEICGDGLVVGVEACDDGDTTADDGCSATCTIEPGWSCTGEPSECMTGCGDGIVAGTEACDDGNTTDDDGCSAACAIEPGWTCDDADPSACVTTCGDGIIAGVEICDDGNDAPDDGCSATCEVEPNWVCEDAPSECESLSVAGGGCSAGGESPLGLGLLLAAGGIVLSRRRRRAVAAIATTLVAVVVTAASPASAQVMAGSTGFPAERFHMATDRDGILGVEAATTPGHLVIDLGLWLGYANDPLTLRLGEDRDRAGALVSDRFGGDLSASVGVGTRLAFALSAPLVLSQAEDTGSFMSAGSLASGGLGDLRVTPKVALLRGGAIDLAFALGVTLPTSGASDYRGDDGLTATPQLVLGRAAGKLRLGAGLGWRMREAKQAIDLAIDDELLVDVGAGFRATDKVEAMASLALATAAADPFASYNRNHAELQAGVGVDVRPGLRIFGAAGAGLGQGFGTPDWRALAGVWIGAGKPRGGRAPAPVVEPVVVAPEPEPEPAPAPEPVVAPPPEPEPEPAPPEPEPDRDRDTVVDASDNCPDEPGEVALQGCKARQLVQLSEGELKLLETIYFQPDRAEIQRRSLKVLDNAAKVLKAHPQISKITIEGHTDDQADESYNKDLSQRRAQAVVDYLIKQGVDAAKLQAVGYGEEQPSADNTTRDGRAKNRRVEFKIE